MFPGDAGVGRGIISTEYYHVSPRLGFAWDPFGDGKTSIRGAAGIFFGIVAGNEWNQPGNAIPFALRPQTGEGPLNSITNYLLDAGRFPLDRAGRRPLSVHLYAEQAHIHCRAPAAPPKPSPRTSSIPTSTSSIFPCSGSCPAGVTLTAAYVGALSHQLPNFIDANYAPYSTAFGTPSTSATSVADRRQFDPCVGACPTGAAAINNGTGILGASIIDLLSNLTANYHSLQVSATKQLSQWLQRQRILCLEPRARYL